MLKNNLTIQGMVWNYREQIFDNHKVLYFQIHTRDRRRLDDSNYRDEYQKINCCYIKSLDDDKREYFYNLLKEQLEDESTNKILQVSGKLNSNYVKVNAMVESNTLKEINILQNICLVKEFYFISLEKNQEENINEMEAIKENEREDEYPFPMGFGG